jgi:hypothetical protein
MRALAVAALIVATLAIAVPALALTAKRIEYTASTTCTGASTTIDIPENVCAPIATGQGTIYVWGKCNATYITADIFTANDCSAASKVDHSEMELNKCKEEGSGKSSMMTCSAGAVAMAVVSAVAVVLASML